MNDRTLKKLSKLEVPELQKLITTCQSRIDFHTDHLTYWKERKTDLTIYIQGRIKKEEPPET